MHLSRGASFAAGLLALCGAALAQHDVPAESCTMSAARAFTWTEGPADGHDRGRSLPARDVARPDRQTSVVQLEGDVRIELDGTVLTAAGAVVWITPVRGSAGDMRRLEVALIGQAVLRAPNDVREERQRLFVEVPVRGSVRLSAGSRSGTDRRESDLYRAASAIRPVLLKGGEPSGGWLIQEEPEYRRDAQRQPDLRPLRPVSISARQFFTDRSSDGKVVAVLAGGVTLFCRMDRGDFLELLADRAVVFTPFTDLSQLGPDRGLTSIEQAVVGVYLEGDVRMMRTPGDRREPEQRLSANRAYYDFTTDRAVLTDVVLHTRDPKNAVPIVLRAQTVRQMSLNEYTAEKARLSISSFNTPSYSIGAASTYIRQTDFGDPVTGTRTHFAAKDATFDIGGVPVFWLPAVAGSVTERPVLRQIETSSSRGFGLGVSTEWGLFETLGRLAPKGVDASYKLDYFTERGPAIGLDGKYAGSIVPEGLLDVWSYSGGWTSYLALDHGEDYLGRKRLDVTPEDELRGRFHWQHQHILPDDWQVQISAGYISDPTFLEEWFNRDFRNSAPLDTALYAIRRRESEAITLLLSVQPNDFATVANQYQEQAEVERLELGYHRVGDAILDDAATFFSSNTVSALRFRNSDYGLDELGFAPAAAGRQSPGIPSIGQTGTPEDETYRGDFRQEVDFPLSVGKYRLVPYVVGRYTPYSESVDGSSLQRLYAAGGMRVTTAFWKVEDGVESRMFDLHRLRHVIEPEVHVYAAAQSEDRSDLLIYDEPVDAITDTSAIQIAVNQRWQTKRGGPGQWRSVDFLTINIQGSFFMNQPPDRELAPTDFRGLLFVTRPETSIPRNSINAQLEWCISDTVSLESELYYNIDESMLASASVGLKVRHDPRISYYIGLRHIGLDFTMPTVQNGQVNTFRFEDQDLLVFALDYELTVKYRVQVAQSYDLAQNRNDRSTLTFVRRFDRFFVAVGFRLDEIQDESAVFFNVWPEGMQPGGGSRAIGSALSN